MKRPPQPRKQSSTKANSNQLRADDRKAIGRLVDALPLLLHNLQGHQPKGIVVAEMLGISVRTLSALACGHHATAVVLKTIHTALTRKCPPEQQRINLALYKALRLDEYLSKYFPGIAEAKQLAAAVPPAAKAGRASTTSAAPKDILPLEVLRLFAAAKGLTDDECARLETIVGCGWDPRLPQMHATLSSHVAVIAQALEFSARHFALVTGLPLDFFRGHVHILGTALDRATNQTARALLPLTHFSLIPSLDSVRPVYMDHDWYTIVNCAREGRTVIQTVDLGDRPNTLEAREVPAIACVLAHPLRKPVTDEVFGTISFDCLAGEAREGAKINPGKTLKALRWSHADSEEPTANVKSMLQLNGNMITRLIHSEDLRALLGT